MARLEDRVSGWWVFAGVLLLIGVLNVIWGIACSSACSSRSPRSRCSLAEASVAVGIIPASLSAISALLSIPAYPFWRFALAIIIIYELARLRGGYGALTR